MTIQRGEGHKREEGLHGEIMGTGELSVKPVKLLLRRVVILKTKLGKIWTVVVCCKVVVYLAMFRMSLLPLEDYKLFL